MTTPTLTTARRRTSQRLAGIELPSCFAEATAAAEAHLIARRESGYRRIADRKDARRLAAKCRRLEQR